MHDPNEPIKDMIDQYSSLNVEETKPGIKKAIETQIESTEYGDSYLKNKTANVTSKVVVKAKKVEPVKNSTAVVEKQTEKEVAEAK